MRLCLQVQGGGSAQAAAQVSIRKIKEFFCVPRSAKLEKPYVVVCKRQKLNPSVAVPQAAATAISTVSAFHLA